MVAGWLADGEQDGLTIGICLVGIGANGKAGHDGVSLAICIVDEKEAICGVLGMEGQPQQPLLVLRATHPVDKVKEGGVGHCFSLQDPNASWLFDDEQPLASIARVGYAYRGIQAAYDFDQAQVDGQRICWPAGGERGRQGRFGRGC